MLDLGVKAVSLCIRNLHESSAHRLNALAFGNILEEINKWNENWHIGSHVSMFLK